MRRVLHSALLIGGMALALVARSAGAHAAFVTSNPAPDSAISALPEQVSITFSETIMKSSSITVTAPDGTVVSGGTAVNDNVAATPVQPAGPGVYRVDWQNTSADDGHEANGTFQFTLLGEAPAASRSVAASPGAAQPAPTLPVAQSAVGAPRTGAGTGPSRSLTASVLPALAAVALVLVPVAAGAPAWRRSRKV